MEQKQLMESRENQLSCGDEVDTGRKGKKKGSKRLLGG